MDITEKFFNIVKECQQIKNVINEETGKSKKGEGVSEPVTYSKFQKVNWKPEENEIKDSFLKEAYQIEKKIYQLQNFLLSIRKSYLNISHLNSTSTMSQVVYFPFNFDDNSDSEPKSIAIQNMTDRQRDDIDQLSRQYIKSCEVQISNLNLKIKHNLDEIIGERRGSFFSKKNNEFDIHKQLEVNFLHRESIVYSLNILLMKVADILKTQQEKRLEQNLQKKESLVHKTPDLKKSVTETMLSSKLGTGASAKFKFLNNKNPFKTPGSFSSTPASSNASPHNNTEFNTPINVTGGGENANDLNISNSSLNNRSFPSIEDEINNYYEFEENELSQELRMELEQENEELLEELESDMNQVRQATQSINEISKLQATLSQQLQIQQNIIETLHEDSWKSVDTMKQANQKLLSAQRYFSDRRVWMLFFLIISSLILLFLDWFYS